MPVKVYPAYAMMSSKGASPLPNESNVTLSSAACINQPSNPLMNNKFNASGLNLDINTAAVRNHSKTNYGKKKLEMEHCLDKQLS